MVRNRQKSQRVKVQLRINGSWALLRSFRGWASGPIILLLICVWLIEAASVRAGDDKFPGGYFVKAAAAPDNPFISEKKPLFGLKKIEVLREKTQEKEEKDEIDKAFSKFKAALEERVAKEKKIESIVENTSTGRVSSIDGHVVDGYGTVSELTEKIRRLRKYRDDKGGPCWEKRYYFDAEGNFLGSEWEKTGEWYDASNDIEGKQASLEDLKRYIGQLPDLKRAEQKYYGNLVELPWEVIPELAGKSGDEIDALIDASEVKGSEHRIGDVPKPCGDGDSIGEKKRMLRDRRWKMIAKVEKLVDEIYPHYDADSGRTAKKVADLGEGEVLPDGTTKAEAHPATYRNVHAMYLKGAVRHPQYNSGEFPRYRFKDWLEDEYSGTSEEEVEWPAAEVRADKGGWSLWPF